MVAPGLGADYEQISIHKARAIVHRAFRGALGDALARGTLYEWAAAQPDRREYRGRLPVYGVSLGDARVVVRRNHHGGLLAPILGDRFTLSRAARELAVSLLLAREGIATPEILAFVTYRINLIQVRADIVTRELPPGRDFGEALLQAEAGPQRDAQWHAVAHLLRGLTDAGAWHRDLNVKNIYLVDQGAEPPVAAVLDVDRVLFAMPSPTMAEANFARLRRSLRKWRATRGARITDAEIATFGAMVKRA